MAESPLITVCPQCMTETPREEPRCPRCESQGRGSPDFFLCAVERPKAGRKMGALFVPGN